MKTRNLLFAALLLLVTACGQKYSVTADCNTSFDGKQAYIYDLVDSKIAIDSAIVTEGKAVFEGSTKEPRLCTFAIKGTRVNVMFVLEKGNIAINVAEKAVSGSEQNDAIQSLHADLESTQEPFYASYQALDRNDPEFRKKLADLESGMQEAYGKVMISYIEKMPTSCVAAYALINWLPSLVREENFDQAAAYVTKDFLQYRPIKNAIETRKSIAVTGPGKMFIDFEIANGNLDGTRALLSHYVGKGKYVLVDFWASWCGPCRGEIPNIKRIHQEFAGDKFEVLSVAVWDKRDATLAALEEEKLPWPQIIDAQSIPTQLYGISGIPQIILFGPDGRIVERDLRGEHMYNTVKELVSK